MTTTQTVGSPLTTPTLVIGAIAALFGALGLAPFFGVIAAPLAFIAGIAAVVIGHIAIGKTTDARARIGLTLGYVGLGLTVGMIVFRFAAAA